MREERLTLCKTLIPYISDTEQEEIEAELGSLSDYEDGELIVYFDSAELEIYIIGSRGDVYK